MGKRKEKTKVKTAITIDPNLLQSMRFFVDSGRHASVSAGIEHAVREYLRGLASEPLEIKGKDGSVYTLPVLSDGTVDWDKCHADPGYMRYHSKSLETAIQYDCLARMGV